MQLAYFEVNNLFGRFRHEIPFPTRPDESDDDGAPSITILHGPNGVGKTTVLRMLDGFMRRDFSVFRRVPFDSARLRFSLGGEISVRPLDVGGERPLEVTFGDLIAILHPDHRGAYREEHVPEVERFGEAFDAATEGIDLDFIEVSRLRPLDDDDADTVTEEWLDPVTGRVQRRPRRARKRDERPLGVRVQRFIRDAQVDYRRFFTRTEPELFPRIMQRITTEDAPEYDLETLAKTLSWVRDQSETSVRLGLGVEPWDYDELMGYIQSLDTGARPEYALTVLGAYTEFLESRAAQRDLVAQRLLRFESILDNFYANKRVRVDARQGLLIETSAGEELTESQLSSGEQHLLYLMVAALTTLRRGTVIAIDEPELSMHIAWQRMLIRNLLECASNASPQLVLATHSPEIIADYRDSLIPLTA